MAHQVVMPKLGETMKEGILVNFRVQEGDSVAKGDILFDIETDKASLEMESPESGIVKKIFVIEGQTVPIETPILMLSRPGEVLADDDMDRMRSEVQKHAGAGGLSGSSVISAEAEDSAAFADSLRDAEARARCSEMVSQPPKLGSRLPLGRMQKIVAEKMLWSKRNIPCFYLNVRVDATLLAAFRGQLNAAGDVKYSINDFIVRAMALGIEHYPLMTSVLAGDYLQLSDRIDIGLAVSTDDGVVAPIIHDCGKKTLAQIHRDAEDVIERTRMGRLTLEDLTGGCTSISNLGAFGVDSFIPIVIPGQSSILGVGTIQDTVLPVDKEPAVRKIMNLTLSVDHKVINGAEAAQFLDFMKKLLEHPEELV